LAVELAIEKGKVPWPGEIPGYIRDADSRLTPDDEMVAVIVRAFEIRKDGATIDAVRAHLLANGIELSYTATQHLLGDRIYLGEIHFGTHTPNLEAHKADRRPRAVRRGAEDQDLAREAREVRPATRADRRPAVRELRLADGCRHEQQRGLPRLSLPRQRLHAADDDLGRHGGKDGDREGRRTACLQEQERA